MSESAKAGKVTLDVSPSGRPIIYIADFYYRCLPGTAVEYITNSAVFSTREEAIRWAKFSLRAEIDWDKWAAPQGQYPYESARDDATLDPTFIAEITETFPEGTTFKRVRVHKTEVCQEFDWWAKEANGNWNSKSA